MRHIVLAALALLPSPVMAQAGACLAPARLPTIRPDLPSASQPRRVVPIANYTLAISWAPEYCRSHDRDWGSFQCDARGGTRFGFVLHGLWPDGAGKDQWPQYCAATDILPDRVVRGMMCTTPSAQLIQHEWAKHATCMPNETPESYFGRSKTMFDRLRFPDMDRLSRRRLTVAQFRQAFAAANRVRANTMVVTTKRGGWLDEIWMCHDMAFRPMRCPADKGGAPLSGPLRIWRGGR